MAVVFTRIGFCQKCFKEARPISGQFFIIHNGIDFEARVAKLSLLGHSNIKGLVPHIYILIKIIAGNVIFRKICCMNKCGSYIKRVQNGTNVYIDEDNWGEEESTSYQNWIALVNFTETLIII